MFRFLEKLLRRECKPTLFEEWCAGRQTFPVHLRCDQTLTRREYLLEGGDRSGTANWWLAEVNGPFVPIELPRGCEVVDVDLLLPVAHYVLGVGKTTRKIRNPFFLAEIEPRKFLVVWDETTRVI